MKRRKLFKEVLYHCYQRTADRGILFYTVSDHLVFFTVYCTLARKWGIRVLALCQMPDHIHDSVQGRHAADIGSFKREANAAFARRWNRRCSRRGTVMESPFSCAPKVGDKIIRTNLIYVGNNPVERSLAGKAELYRWNYLAYAVSDHPFSDQLVLRKARWSLLKAVREVKAMRQNERPLEYAQLQRMFTPLDERERRQLVDFIISSYNVIDYQETLRYFGGYEEFLTALHATTGSEYDILEEQTGKSDRHYQRMSAALIEAGILQDLHVLPGLCADEKYRLFLFLRDKVSAPGAQIAKFLHVGRKMQSAE